MISLFSIPPHLVSVCGLNECYQCVCKKYLKEEVSQVVVLVFIEILGCHSHLSQHTQAHRNSA